MKKIRYCSECGTIGNVPKDKRDCCPTAKPSQVPLDVAVQAHAGFHAALALHRANHTVYGSAGRPQLSVVPDGDQS